MPTGIYERTEETNRKISEALSGSNHPMWGKHHSEETKRKMREAHKGKNNSRWKGGIKKSCGYIFILKPDHPKANSNGYVKRARLVAEKILGRYLLPEEITHHKNRIRDDDRPENIEVTTQKKHTTFHNKIRKKLKETQLCQI